MTSRPGPPLPFCHPQLRRRTAFIPPPLAPIRGAHHYGPPPFLLLCPLHRPCAAPNPALQAITEPPWTTTPVPLRAPDTTPSSAPMPRAPSTTLPAPSTASLCPHRRSDCAAIGCSIPVSTTSSDPKIQPPLVAGLLPGHSTANHRPLAGRILLASHRRRWGRRPPLVLPWAESPRRAEHCSSRPYE
jgi:hypothetical protein